MPWNVLHALLSIAAIVSSAFLTLYSARWTLRSRGKARVIPSITLLMWLVLFVHSIVEAVQSGL